MRHFKRLILVCLGALVLAGCVRGGEPEQGIAVEPAAPDAIPMPAPMPEPIEEFAPGGMVASSKLEALAEEWDERGPQTYSYRGQVFAEQFNGPDFGPCGSTGGMLAVEVVDGEVTSARVEDFACEIDPAADERLPLTPAEIFRHVAGIGAQGPGAELVLGDVNVPVYISAEGRDGYYQFDLLDLQVGEESGPSLDLVAAQAELDAAKARWEEARLSEYTIEFFAACQACDGDMTSVMVVGGDEPTAVESFPKVGVEGLFEVLQEHLDREPELFNVIYANATGVPVVGEIDESADFDDDTLQFEVLSVVPVGTPPVSDVLGELGADLDGMPEGLTNGLEGHRYCGLDVNANEVDGPGDDPVARRCLIDGAERGVPSVLARLLYTVEGDPIPTVFVADADGTVSEYADNSADEFGSGGWTSRSCDRGVQANTNWGLNGFDLAC